MKIPSEHKIDRISFKTIGLAILQALSLEKGIGFTLKELLLRPGKTIKEYLFEDRSKYTKPLTLILLLVAVATFVSLRIIPLNETMDIAIENDPSIALIPEKLRGYIKYLPDLLNRYFNVFYLSSIPLIAFGTYFIFKEFRLNFAEHLIINIYLFCVQTLFYILFIPLGLIWPGFVIIHLIAVAAYSIFSYAQVFKQDWWSATYKFVIVYLISQFLMGVLMTIAVGIALIFL